MLDYTTELYPQPILFFTNVLSCLGWPQFCYPPASASRVLVLQTCIPKFSSVFGILVKEFSVLVFIFLLMCLYALQHGRGIKHSMYHSSNQ
jgi:hypothetical protein